MKERGFEIAHLRRGFPRTKRQVVLGFDTEAEGGYPFLLQVAHPNDEVVLFDVDQSTILDCLLRHLERECRDRRATYTLFGFNLSYEYTQLFAGLPEDSWGFSEILYDGGWYRLYVYNERRFTFVIEFPDGRSIRVLDAMAFIPSSLAGAAEMIGAGEKYTKPPVFAKSQRHDPDFIRYAKQDAVLTQRLGEYIVDLHQQQDVPLSMSASHFAAQVYRRHYLVDSVPRPSAELEQLGLDAYHGGKNGFYLPGPVEMPATSYDIRSAYSEAMAALPDIETAIWYPTHGWPIVPHALYRATIRYSDCRYTPIWRLYDTGVQEVTTTGYELLSGLKCGRLDVIRAEGFELRGRKQGGLWRYVQDFYEMKRTATTGAEKTAAKLFLNGLYGKFFQKVPVGKAATFDLRNGQYTIHDARYGYDFIAGGLYHPPIASLITGFVRAKIHELEHRYRAVMTSTDGIFGTQRPDPADVGPNLGQLEYQIGHLRVWRERLYIFEYEEGGTTKTKAATHGFQGGVARLAEIPLEHGSFLYPMTKAYSLREAQGKTDVRPGQFVNKDYRVNIGGTVYP